MVTDAKQMVLDRLKAGWYVWVRTAHQVVWARVENRPGGSVIETDPITPPEGVVLDEVLAEFDRNSA